MRKCNCKYLRIIFASSMCHKLNRSAPPTFFVNLFLCIAVNAPFSLARRFCEEGHSTSKTKWSKNQNSLFTIDSSKCWQINYDTLPKKKMLIDQNQIRFRVFIKDKLKICNSMLSDIGCDPNGDKVSKYNTSYHICSMRL